MSNLDTTMLILSHPYSSTTHANVNKNSQLELHHLPFNNMQSIWYWKQYETHIFGWWLKYLSTLIIKKLKIQIKSFISFSWKLHWNITNKQLLQSLWEKKCLQLAIILQFQCYWMNCKSYNDTTHCIWNCIHIQLMQLCCN
jgi:predicted membrane-bound mannosyltransferase